MGIQKDTVKFNVGGKIFETTATTLANAGRNSLFGAMFDENWNLQTHNFDEYFIDRNPNCVAVLLDLLRTGELCIPSNIPEKLIHREALFYGLLDHIRTAKWGQFDGNRLRFSQSVMGQAPGDGTAIRAGPGGGCCAVHGSMVHVYDWMLEEHPPINLDYQRVNDVGWIDSETVVVTTCGLGAAVAGWVCLVQEQGSSGIDFKSLMMIK
ncbi:BTB/POZ domain-containing protein [Camellia lanceoleosa]|uniref:BTB/POZ domain-containing protein n=1 Tax=Camellia lanceoleosa TaxID=1840588 RepID=A0ACC0HYE9_9ERIC|nr:BTB/POZ domain-containing protein [Camellia lanceoleosa]